MRLESGAKRSSEPREGEVETTVSETPSLPSEQDGDSFSKGELLTAAKFASVESKRVNAETQSVPQPEVDQSALTGWTGSPIQSVGMDTNVTPAEPGRDSEVLNEPNDTIDAGPSAVDGPSPSGPLSGFNLPREIIYTGAMSRGVCLACGAESGADELFCLSCGDFVDEVPSALPSNPACGECKQPIDADEICCPWCGAAVPAQR